MAVRVSNKAKMTTMRGMAAIMAVTALAGQASPALAQTGLSIGINSPDASESLTLLSPDSGISRVTMECGPGASAEAQGSIFFMQATVSSCFAKVTHDPQANFQIINSLLPELTGADLLDTSQIEPLLQRASEMSRAAGLPLDQTFAEINDGLQDIQQIDVDAEAAQILANTFEGGNANNLWVPRVEVMGGLKPELLSIGVVTLNAELSVGVMGEYWTGDAGPQGFTIQPKARAALELAAHYQAVMGKVAAFAETNLPRLGMGETPSVLAASGLMDGNLSSLVRLGVEFRLAASLDRVSVSSDQELAASNFDVGLRGGYTGGTSFDTFGTDGVANIKTNGGFLGGLTLQETVAEFGNLDIKAGVDVMGSYQTGVRASNNTALFGLIDGHLPTGADLEAHLGPYVDELNDLIRRTEFRSLPQDVQTAIPQLIDRLANLPADWKSQLPPDVQAVIADAQNADYRAVPEIIRSLAEHLSDPNYAEMADALRNAVNEFVTDTNDAWVPTQNIAVYSAKIVPMLRASYGLTENLSLELGAGAGVKANLMTYGNTTSFGAQLAGQVEAGISYNVTDTFNVTAIGGLNLDGPGINATNRGNVNMTSNLAVSGYGALDAKIKF